MTPLRQRFLDDLRLRNYAARTIETYLRCVVHFAKHFGKSPEMLGGEEVRAYQLHLLAQKASWSKFNQSVSALRFLYRTTLGRPEVVLMLPYGKRPKSLPAVLSQQEVLRLFEVVSPAGGRAGAGCRRRGRRGAPRAGRSPACTAPRAVGPSGLAAPPDRPMATARARRSTWATGTPTSRRCWRSW